MNEIGSARVVKRGKGGMGERKEGMVRRKGEISEMGEEEGGRRE